MTSSEDSMNNKRREEYTNAVFEKADFGKLPESPAASAWDSPEALAFRRGLYAFFGSVGNLLVCTEKYLWHRIGRFGTRGWRPAFCWSGGAVVICAMAYAFIIMPSQHNAALPEYFYTQLNAALLLMLGAMGLRSWDKMQERTTENSNG